MKNYSTVVKAVTTSSEEQFREVQDYFRKLIKEAALSGGVSSSEGLLNEQKPQRHQ